MKLLVTGGCGYIGSRLAELLSGREEIEHILLTDVRPPRRAHPKTDYRSVDVRDRQAMAEVVAAEGPDALLHLAFILNPMHDEGAMYEIDVNGTHNVLDAAAEAKVKHVLVASSTTAYGAFPDNPRPLTEDDPVRGMANYAYARDKTETDRMCQLWAARHSRRKMTIFRPCIVFGPSVDNYIVRSWERFPFFPLLDGLDEATQFVHEDDLVEGIAQLVLQEKAGIYNITGDGTVAWSECARIAGVKTRRTPYKPYKRFAAAMWTVHGSEAPPGQLDFLRYPWVASNEKLKAETGWQPRFSSRETFEITMKARGLPKKGAQPQPAPTPTAA